MTKDWTGNHHSTFTTLGARNYAQNEREINDYYATEPKAARLLMEVENFSPAIWECACGEGHLAKEFEKAGYKVYASDIVNRGYGSQADFLQSFTPRQWIAILSQIRRIQKLKSLLSTLLAF